jgi:uncharacterized membrane protein YjgN (DUF898 family)
MAILAGGAWLPYIKLKDNNYGIWFISGKGKKTAQIAVPAGSLFTVAFVLISELLPDPETLLPSVPAMILTGLIPFIIVAGMIYTFMKTIQKKYSLGRSEYIQTLVILLVISYTVLSLIGIFFRGEGMNLMWPWQI